MEADAVMSVESQGHPVAETQQTLSNTACVSGSLEQSGSEFGCVTSSVGASMSHSGVSASASASTSASTSTPTSATRRQGAVLYVEDSVSQVPPASGAQPVATTAVGSTNDEVIICEEDSQQYEEPAPKRVKRAAASSNEASQPGSSARDADASAAATQTRHDDENGDEEEGAFCPICFEAWANEGEHRIVALPCGHLFGQRCIQDWLDGRGNACPNCSNPTKATQVFPLYIPKGLRVSDDSEIIKLKTELDQARKNLASSREAVVEQAKQITDLHAQIRTLSSQARALRRRSAASTGAAACSSGPGASADAAEVIDLTDDRNFQAPTLASTIKLSQRENRVLACESTKNIVLASARSSVATPFFPRGGFGIVAVNWESPSTKDFLQLHTATIRDVKCSPSGSGLILTASVDKTVKVSSMNTKSVVQQYKIGTQAWACSWNPLQQNYFYVGLNSDKIRCFDIRMPGAHVSEWTGPTDCPVFCLESMAYKQQRSLLSGSLREGIGLWKLQEGTEVEAERLPVPDMTGPCISISTVPKAHRFLATFRSTRACPMVRHVVASCGSGGQPIEVLRQLNGGAGTDVAARSVLFAAHDRPDSLVAAASNQDTKSVMLWDADSGSLLCEVAKQRPQTYDMLKLGERHLLRLCDGMIDVFEWQS